MTSRSVAGSFILVGWTSYSSFLTYAVVIDSMQDEATAARTDGIHWWNRAFRYAMHTMMFLIFIYSLNMKSCSDRLVPIEFNFLAIFVFINAAFMLYLHFVHANTPEKFLFNPAELPPMSLNKLRYNYDLFE